MYIRIIYGKLTQIISVKEFNGEKANIGYSTQK